MVSNFVAARELLQKLKKAGAIRAEPPVQPGVPRLIDVGLRHVVHSDASWAKKLAQPFYTAVAMAYDVGNSVRRPRPFGLISATVGIEPIVTVLGMLFSQALAIDFIIPMPAALTRMRNGDNEIHIYGGPQPNYCYALLDDISRGGGTIIEKLYFWVRHGYQVDQVIVFTDRGEGGIRAIMAAAEEMSKARGFAITVSCLITPEEILQVIDEQ